MSENSDGRSIQFKLSGFVSDEEARAAGNRVAKLIGETCRSLSLTIAGLDGVTIAVDYDRALAQLDRGFTATSPLTRTKDEVAEGWHHLLLEMIQAGARVMTASA